MSVPKLGIIDFCQQLGVSLGENDFDTELCLGLTDNHEILIQPREEVLFFLCITQFTYLNPDTYLECCRWLQSTSLTSTADLNLGVSGASQLVWIWRVHGDDFDAVSLSRDLKTLPHFGNEIH